MTEGSREEVKSFDEICPPFTDNESPPQKIAKLDLDSTDNTKSAGSAAVSVPTETRSAAVGDMEETLLCGICQDILYDCVRCVRVRCVRVSLADQF